MISVLVFTAVVVLVGLIGLLTIGREKEVIQGQIEVEEYRVSSKVPSRVLRLLVKEGDYVHVGDTLAILDAPAIEAKAQQAMGAESAAEAMSDMARAGARKEQIQGAYELWQQAKAGLDIAKKSYERVQRLYDEGVVSEQKRDEAYAQYKAYEAQEKAAKSQYDMAKIQKRCPQRRKGCCSGAGEESAGSCKRGKLISTRNDTGSTDGGRGKHYIPQGG